MNAKPLNIAAIITTVSLLSACGSNDSDNSGPANITTDPVDNPDVTSAQKAALVPPQSEDALKEYLQQGLLDTVNSYTNRQNIPVPTIGAGDADFDAVTNAESVPESSADGSANGASDEAASGGNDDGFSTTNVQVEGTDEADTVKYDGDYIYLVESKDNNYYGIPEAFVDLPVDALPVDVSADDMDLPKDPDSESSERIADGGEGSSGSNTLDLVATTIAEGEDGDFDGVADELIAPFPYPEATPPSIRIMKTEDSPPSAAEVSRITLDSTDKSISGIYLYNSADDKTLAVISSDGNYDWYRWSSYASWSEQHTQLTLFSVNNPQTPSQTWTVDLEGVLIDSRRIGDKIYLVTRHSPNINSIDYYAGDEASALKNNDIIESLDISALLPDVSVNDAAPVDLVSAENCYVPNPVLEPYYSPALITITSVDLQQPDAIQSVCIGGYSSGIFSTAKALYLFNDRYNYGTEIHKFAYTDAGPAYSGSGDVPGTLGGSEPAFRLGENAGALFVVSTDYSNNFFGGDLIGQPEPAILIDEDAASSTSLAGAPVEGVKEEVIDPNLDLFIPEAASPIHRLTVLRESAGDDFNLERIAQLPSEAQPAPIGKPGEDIYSVRLLGDRGYIVTFQKTDPLYVLDLSNPEDPRVTGELVIDGYSDYLHPVGDDLLIGVGKDSVNDGRTAWYQGIKIALFDVSDPSNPAEITSKIVGSRGSETPVSYDHKAFSFLNMGSGQYRMVLPIQVNDGVQDQPWEWTNWSHTGLHLYDVSVPDNASDAEFTAAGVIIASQTSDTQNWNDYVQTQRGIIDGDAVHYVYGNEVISADWNDPVNTATQRQ